MQYLKSFSLVSAISEDDFILNFPYQLEMQCYSNTNVYPFKIFPNKKLSFVEFEPITIFYGSNGSGKSTLLNIIAEKLQIERISPFNRTPFTSEYTKRCKYEMFIGKRAPSASKIITSDDVFDFLLDIRSINERIDKRRDELFDEYDRAHDPNFHFTLRSLDDYEELRRVREAKSKTKSSYTARRLSKEVDLKSNGESAFAYFTNQIKQKALYLLDEPENSLSPKLQLELLTFIEESVRFYDCQFVISTHSPFLLSLRDAKIYDLDTVPVKQRNWTELENVKLYYDFFQKHKDKFDRFS